PPNLTPFPSRPLSQSRNNLKSLVDRDRLTTLLETLGINPQARPEELDVQQWVALSDKVSQDEIGQDGIG
ncbi:MAG: hypothetical protein F6K09_26180, partial [Merismopedia sp. SIO2A8]|nr:hypothetical protein [Merismopedia sp. SIO2A8]